MGKKHWFKISYCLAGHAGDVAAAVLPSASAPRQITHYVHVHRRVHLRYFRSSSDQESSYCITPWTRFTLCYDCTNSVFEVNVVVERIEEELVLARDGNSLTKTQPPKREGSKQATLRVSHQRPTARTDAYTLKFNPSNSLRHDEADVTGALKSVESFHSIWAWRHGFVDHDPCCNSGRVD